MEILILMGEGGALVRRRGGCRGACEEAVMNCLRNVARSLQYTTLMNHDRLDVGRPAEIAEIIFGDARDIRFDITGRCREPASERRHRYQN